MEMLRILLAEDDEFNRLIIRKVVHDSGFALDIVGTGKQVIEQLIAHDYDLVLMDVNMPEMDGYAAITHIRQHLDGKSNIPIIVITSRNDVQEAAKSLLLGANSFLPKPFEHELLAEISTLVVKHSHHR